MKKNKRVKSLILFTMISLIAVTSFILLEYVFGISFQDNSKEKNLSAIVQEYPTQIIVLGEQFNIGSEYDVRYIDEITDENLKSDSKYMFTVLVINDLSDKVILDDEDWEILNKHIGNDLNLYYFGTKYINNIKSKGYCGEKLSDKAMSIAYVHEAETPSIIYGMWSEENNRVYNTRNDDLLSDMLMSSIVNDIICKNIS